MPIQLSAVEALLSFWLNPLKPLLHFNSHQFKVNQSFYGSFLQARQLSCTVMY